MTTGSEDVSAIYELLYNPSYRPRASPNSHIEKMTVSGKPAFILMKRAEGEYYEVDATTNAVWQLMDGNRTVKEIFEEARSSDETLTDKEVKDIIVSLAEEGAVESTEPEVQHRRVELVSAFQLDVHLLKDSSESLAGFFQLTRKLLRREELLIALAIAVLGFALFFSNFLRIFAEPSIFDVAGSAILGFFFYQLFVLLPVYAVHELAHAAVCDRYGGKPREIGTGLYYLAPFFYCDTSDSWRLSRRARVMISVAGPLSTVVISSILVFFSFLTPPGYPQDVLRIAAFFGYYGTLTNFSPVIETDGYYILADALNIPNLRDEAFSYIKRFFLALIGRPVSVVHRSARQRRIIVVYTVITVAWLLFFGYTTIWLLGLYGHDAYTSIVGISLTLLHLRPFDPTAFGVNVATLAYFGLTVAGFAVMGVVAAKNIRMRGAKLETIHDKRVSVFLPLPSTIQRSEGSELAAKARRRAAEISHSYSVTLELPICVANLKLGKVDESLDALKGEMQKIEESFRSLHREFLSRRRRSGEATSKERAMADNLSLLAKHFAPIERKSALSAVSHFLEKQQEMVGFLLQSSFGTVWTLELSPEDYRRVRREMFPGLIAEDLGATDLPSDLLDFKRRTVLGYDTIADLSSEIEKESKEVNKRPEVYQITAFLEPMKSRLVFLGRTDRVEGSIDWLGGLYLYQAWTSYIRDALDDAALGLKSIRLVRPASLTKTQLSKLLDAELEALWEGLGRMEALTKTVEDSISRIESTFQSGVNFHETLESLLADEAFDIGLYKPILQMNGRHLDGVREEIEKFRTEFGRVSKRIAASVESVREERSTRLGASSNKNGWLDALRRRVLSSGWTGRRSRSRSPAFDAEIKLMFTTSRLVYGVVVGSDIIL